MRGNKIKAFLNVFVLRMNLKYILKNFPIFLSLKLIQLVWVLVILSEKDDSIFPCPCTISCEEIMEYVLAPFSDLSAISNIKQLKRRKRNQ